jgi:PAS domain S-box-containing protein
MSRVSRSSPIKGRAKASAVPPGSCSALPTHDLGDQAGAAAHLAQIESKHRLVAEALRTSEERYQILLEGVEDYAIFTLDPKGQILTCNSGAERIKGYSSHQIIGQNFSCFFPPEEIRAGRPAEILRLTAANGRHEEHCMRVRKDGSRFLAGLTFTALRDPAGNLTGFSEFSHDLSERDVTGVNYRGLLEAAPDAMVVVNRDSEIVLVNLKAERQFGYCRDELLGQNVRNIIPEGFAERLIADSLRSAADALTQQIGSGIELTGRRKDGSEFPMELMLSPLDSADGILVTAAIRDISARKAADRHLAQMESRYRALLEAAPDAMVVVNPRGEIVLLNVQAEKQFGYRRDELLGRKISDIIPAGFAERLIADGLRSAADASAQQIGGGIELAGKRKDRSVFPIEIMLSPLDSVDGILVTAAIRDITARKKAEAHLRHISEIERMQSEFVSTVSHELRTPLTSIGGSLGLIAGGAAGVISDRAARLIEIANKNTQRLIRLVNDILDIEKLQSGRMVFQLAPVRIEEVLRQAILANLAYAASFGIELRRTGDESDAIVAADAGRLNQAVTNLISNAVKFSPTGGCVEISASRTEGSVRISVADRGPGIPEEFRPRIFERFAQADSSDMRQRGGSGLGLSIAREIVQRHCGSISFDSVVGKGAIFHLDFPLVGKPDQESLRLAADSYAARAFVCAVNAAVADPICAVLRTRGIECAAVITEEQALSAAADGAGDSGTMDLASVGEDLSGLVRALRDRRGGDHFPVVLLCVESIVRDRLERSQSPHSVKHLLPGKHYHHNEAADGRVEAFRAERPAILHVEDDRDVLEVVHEALRAEFRVVAAPTLDIARQRLLSDRFDLIILDLTLSDGLGKDLIPHLVDAAGVPIPIVVFTAQDSTPELAVQAVTVLTKSRDNLAALVETVRSAIAATGRRTFGIQEAQNDAA